VQDDEESLARRAQQRDTEAFSQLYERYFDKMYRYIVFKIGNQSEAEDLTQQVFLKAWESVDSYKWRGFPFASWLFRIAHNQVVDYYRKNKKAHELPLDGIDLVSFEDPVEDAEKTLRAESLIEACGYLTRAQREVILLRFNAGLSTAEVAKSMGKSEGAIKALQHSALVALRKVVVPEKMEM